MRQQTELLRQQTELLRKQNQAAKAVPAHASPPQASLDAVLTNGMLNCNGWRIAPTEARLVYMMGILDGFQIGMMSSDVPAEKVSVEIQKWMGKVPLTTTERVDAMDAFCTAPENSAIQVVFAVQVTAMKTDGFTADQVQAMTAVLRRQVEK
jgi:hypothetical protein